MKIHFKINFDLFRRNRATVRMCATQAFDGNFLFVFAGYGIRLVRMAVLIAVFRSLPPNAGMTFPQMLTYTVLASALSEQLYFFTPATTALWEGSIVSRFTRPVPVLSDLVAETVGKWFPSLVFYTLPLCIIAPLFGVRLLPQSAEDGIFFLLSLLLSISLGFAVDFIFASIAMRLKNGCFMALAVREAVTAVFSGLLVPFALLPKPVGDALELLPFGSLAGAPLSLFIGTGDALRLIPLALFWNAVLWPVSLLFFQKSRERMISYGG